MNLIKKVSYALAHYRQTQKLYHTYQQLSADHAHKPITVDDFAKLVEEERRTIGYLHRKKVSGLIKQPVCYSIVAIDDLFNMYTGIHGNEVIVNIWTKDETIALLGKDPFIKQQGEKRAS